jgi:hypothetical protein
MREAFKNLQVTDVQSAPYDDGFDTDGAHQAKTCKANGKPCRVNSLPGPDAGPLWVFSEMRLP